MTFSLILDEERRVELEEGRLRFVVEFSDSALTLLASKEASDGMFFGTGNNPDLFNRRCEAFTGRLRGYLEDEASRMEQLAYL